MFDRDPARGFWGESKVKPTQVVRMIFKSVSVGIKNDLEKNDLVKVSTDIGLDLRFSGIKALAILRHCVGDVARDVRVSSYEVHQELRRSFYAARKKFKERWPVIVPDQEKMSKSAS